MRNFGFVGKLLLATLLLLSQLTQLEQTVAQKDNSQNGHGNVFEPYPIISSRVRIISIDAQILSRTTGSAVAGLRNTDFTISEDSVQQQVFAWSRLPAPLSLMIVVDPVAIDAADHSVDNQLNALRSSLAGWLQPGDEASIMVMADRPIVLREYTSSAPLINAALDRVPQHKRASRLPAEKRLNMALQEAARHARAVQNYKARCVTVLISDLGEKDVGKVVVPEAVVRATIESRSIFCWKRSDHLSRLFSDERKYSLDNVSIVALVGLTGGEFVSRQWQGFVERLRTRHRIVFLPFSEREGEVIRIGVELKPSATRDSNDLVLIYPRFAVIPSLQ